MTFRAISLSLSLCVYPPPSLHPSYVHIHTSFMALLYRVQPPLGRGGSSFFPKTRKNHAQLYQQSNFTPDYTFKIKMQRVTHTFLETHHKS